MKNKKQSFFGSHPLAKIAGSVILVIAQFAILVFFMPTKNGVQLILMSEQYYVYLMLLLVYLLGVLIGILLFYQQIPNWLGNGEKFPEKKTGVVLMFIGIGFVETWLIAIISNFL